MPYIRIDRKAAKRNYKLWYYITDHINLTSNWNVISYDTNQDPVIKYIPVFQLTYCNKSDIDKSVVEYRINFIESEFEKACKDLENYIRYCIEQVEKDIIEEKEVKARYYNKKIDFEYIFNCIYRLTHNSFKNSIERQKLEIVIPALKNKDQNDIFDSRLLEDDIINFEGKYGIECTLMNDFYKKPVIKLYRSYIVNTKRYHFIMYYRII